jgi:hypothetical protein
MRTLVAGSHAEARQAVKAIKVSAKLLAGRYPQTPGDQASSGVDGTAFSSAQNRRAD